MFGPEAFPVLVELNRKLSYFDPYGRRVTPLAARNLREMEQKMTEVDATWEQFQATAQHPGALSALTQMEWHIAAQKQFIAALKKNPALAQFAGNAEQARKTATAEVALDPDRDTFLSAYDFTGGYPARYYANRCEKRLATWIYGAKTVYPAMTAQFQVDPFPPEGNYELILSGQDDETQKQCRIRVAVNESTIFEGANGFVRSGWSRRTFAIPAGALKRHNTLVIQSKENLGSYGGPPFFMLNYAVVRKGE